MTRITFPATPVPISLQLGPALHLSDDELFEVCIRNRELRIERTAEGNLTVGPPKGGESSHRNAVILAALGVWAREDASGVGFDSTAGFLLPNGAMRAPSAAWVRSFRLDGLSREQKRRFLPLCPDFVVELRPESDHLPDLRAKMDEYRDNGAALGWLIDPEKRRVHVYRPGREVEVLDDPPEISGDPELPGFVLDLQRVWAPL